MKYKLFPCALMVFLVLILFPGCRKKETSPVITIAEQYGLAYAPLQVMKEKRILEQKYPEAVVQWIKLSNTAAIREAVLSGTVDAAFLGIPPFLIGRDRGMTWKLATGLSSSPLGLVVNRKQISSLEEITAEQRIALPQPGSIQHILLGMTLKNRGLASDRLDKNLVALKHPDGMNALLSGAVQGHYTSPPYLFMESDKENMTLLVTGEDAMEEPFTFIAGMVTEEFRKKEEGLYNAFLSSVEEAVDFVREHPTETAGILAPLYRMDTALLEDYLTRPGMTFSTRIRGLQKFVDYMREEELIRGPENASEVLF